MALRAPLRNPSTATQPLSPCGRLRLPESQTQGPANADSYDPTGPSRTVGPLPRVSGSNAPTRGGCEERADRVQTRSGGAAQFAAALARTAGPWLDPQHPGPRTPWGRRSALALELTAAVVMGSLLFHDALMGLVAWWVSA